MTRQYLAVEFKPGGRRYTYANDGEPAAIGDLVRIETRFGGQQIVTVAALVIEEPEFECKPILGRVGDSINSSEENEHAR